MGLWTLNRSLAPSFIDKLRTGQLKTRPDAILGTYGAGEGRGSECRKPLCASRFLGWESWKLGVQNCSTNPYFKGWLYYTKSDTRDLGIAGERWVSYIDRQDLSVALADCPFLDGIRDGMEEGNLAAILSWYLDRLDPAAASVATWRARARRLLSSDPGAILPWEEGERYGMKVWTIQGGKPEYLRAKRELLELFAAIRPEAIRAVKPALYWHDVTLARDGRPVAAIYRGKIDAAPLTAAIQDIGGLDIPVYADATTMDPQLETAVVIGTGDQNPLLRADLSALKPGSYIIREFPAEPGQPKTLLIAGPDAAGTRKGMVLFARFLRADGNWLLR